VSYSIFVGPFFAGHGYPIVITTHPELKGNDKTLETHAFYSDKPASYSMTDFKYETGGTVTPNDALLSDMAKRDGQNHIEEYLKDNSQFRYEAYLAGFIEKISSSDERFLIQLHLGNFLNDQIESNIELNTSNFDLKALMSQLQKYKKVTKRKKT
jgi:hypothetical protein